ncbi:MAG: hypothetical protein A3F90_00785 [Deltaproteobacteria bacterium RIFCSPLOWO2_12_FULL_60_19]|nr:MAG: hypothetical protein A3F90_00785 [Deltaproteobacteria bacterium RIFCSPLOWO2_12_FULL_60_19]
MFAKLILAVVFLLAGGCAAPQAVGERVPRRDRLHHFQSTLAALRGLEFRREVSVELKSEAEIKLYFQRDLELEYGDQRLAHMALAYAKLGLLPKGSDLKKTLIELYGTQVVAFYDPRAGKLVLPDGMSRWIAMDGQPAAAERDVASEMVLAHELTHALQDQHFGLGEKLKPSADGDRDLALRAVAEGDATLSGYGYLFGGLDGRSLAETSRAVQDSLKEARSSMAGVPEALVEELLFQYYGGVAFVSRLLAERGWSGVDRLYASPPLSTEQVLHPEKYFALADPPTTIELKNLSSLFSPEWVEIENEVLGELMAQVLFKQFLPESEAKLIAGGWDGDRFVAFRRGGEIAFIWATVWDSEKDAEEFTRGYQEILAKKYSGAGADGNFYLESRDQRAIVVEGLGRNFVKEKIAAVWQGMALKQEPANTPFAPVSNAVPAAIKPILP